MEGYKSSLPVVGVDLMAETMFGIETELVRLNAPVYNRLKEVFGEKREPAAVYGLLSEFLLVEGKGIRPALCLLSCEAVGGKIDDALKAATTIEMFHTSHLSMMILKIARRCDGVSHACMLNMVCRLRSMRGMVCS